jgi:hypothetical protein
MQVPFVKVVSDVIVSKHNSNKGWVIVANCYSQGSISSDERGVISGHIEDLKRDYKKDVILPNCRISADPYRNEVTVYLWK